MELQEVYDDHESSFSGPHSQRKEEVPTVHPYLIFFEKIVASEKPGLVVEMFYGGCF